MAQRADPHPIAIASAARGASCGNYSGLAMALPWPCRFGFGARGWRGHKPGAGAFGSPRAEVPQFLYVFGSGHCHARGVRGGAGRVVQRALSLIIPE